MKDFGAMNRPFALELIAAQLLIGFQQMNLNMNPNESDKRLKEAVDGPERGLCAAGD